MNAVQNSVPSLSTSDGGGKLTEVVEVDTEAVELATEDTEEAVELIMVDVDTSVEVWDAGVVLPDVTGIAVDAGCCSSCSCRC